MHKFKKGDMVKLVRLDGTLSSEAFAIHDIWGDESHARNASFIIGGEEQFSHTDLMKHVDDTSPVVVPNGGEWYIARGNNMGWGRGETMKKAIGQMRRQGGKVTSYVVHKVSKWTMVDGMGSLSYPIGISPVEVKAVGMPVEIKTKH